MLRRGSTPSTIAYLRGTSSASGTNVSTVCGKKV